jgi:rRNA-processing protein CGR1
LTSYEQRAKARVAQAAVKAMEKEMKEEKEAERQVRSPSRKAMSADDHQR